MDAARAGCRAPPHPGAPAQRDQHRAPGGDRAGPGSPPPLSAGCAGTPPGAGRGQPPPDPAGGTRSRSGTHTHLSPAPPRAAPSVGSPRPLVTGLSPAHPGGPSRGAAEEEDVPRGGGWGDIVAQGPGLGLGFPGCPGRQRAPPGAGAGAVGRCLGLGPLVPARSFLGKLCPSRCVGRRERAHRPRPPKMPTKLLGVFAQDVLRLPKAMLS